MALSVPEAVHSELQALGVQLSDPVDKFWDVFGGRLKEHNRSTCKAIAEDLQEEFACISVGSMRNPDLTAHDFEKLIVKHAAARRVGFARSSICSTSRSAVQRLPLQNPQHSWKPSRAGRCVRSQRALWAIRWVRTSSATMSSADCSLHGTS